MKRLYVGDGLLEFFGPTGRMFLLFSESNFLPFEGRHILRSPGGTSFDFLHCIISTGSTKTRTKKNTS